MVISKNAFVKTIDSLTNVVMANISLANDSMKRIFLLIDMVNILIENVVAVVDVSNVSANEMRNH